MADDIDDLVEVSSNPNVSRLTSDLAKAARTLDPNEARFLVNAYYTMQDNRIRTNNQIRSLTKSEAPHAVLDWLGAQDSLLEKQIKRALDHFSYGSLLGTWARSITGIGPVTASGLLAHIDLSKAKTAGAIWRFAGLDSTVRWEKGQKRPWNADLKTLCWHIGESFVKVQSNENDFYGKLYVERKKYEEANNEAGKLAGAAADKLARFKIGKDTDAYKAYIQGKLPKAHIHARAKRWAVKLFLSHYHEMGYRLELGQEPPVPYVIAHGGHVHFVPPPNPENIKRPVPEASV